MRTNRTICTAATFSLLCLVSASSALEITTTNLPTGIERTPYNATLEAANGDLPYIWSALPSHIVAWGYNNYGQASVPSELNDATAIYGGMYHNLALKLDGTVVAWGRNEYGQSSVPAGLSNVIAIAAGMSFSMALKDNGSVIAWGQRQNGPTSFEPMVVPDGLYDVVAIAAGASHGLALRSDGSMVAWGYNGSGQTTVPSVLSNNVVAVSASGLNSMALKSDGTVVAWGNNWRGQTDVPVDLSNVVAVAISYFGLALKSNGQVVTWGQWADIPRASELTNVVTIAVGSQHGMAIKNDGTVAAWGNNGFGQTDVPEGLASCTAISAGGYHSLAIQSQLPEGLSLSSTGVISGVPTQVGTTTVTFVVRDRLGATTNKSLTIVVGKNLMPVVDSTIPPQSTVTMVENSSQAFSVAARDPEAQPLSYAWTWDSATVGGNSSNYTHIAIWGSIGSHALSCGVSDGVSSNVVYATWQVDVQDFPLQISTESLPGGTELFPYVATLNATNGVSPYRWSVNSDIVAWGNNSYGQTTVPLGLPNAIAVAGGGQHSLALKSDGKVVAWGRNNYGQTNPPAGLSNVVAIAAGADHNLALKSDGTVVAWGCNISGQTSPPAGLSNVVAIAAGYQHNLALESNGIVIAWGNNSRGQTTVPSGLSNAIAVAGGGQHSLALKSDGKVVAWGRNNYGQTNPPAGLSNVVAIAAGVDHNLALKSDGTVVAWGRNDNGQATVPPGLSSVVAIDGGAAYSLALKNDGTVVGWGSNAQGQTTIPSGLINVVTIAAGWDYGLLLDRAVLSSIGLSCSTAGVVSGTPTFVGTNAVNFVVVDSVGATTNKLLEIVIVPHPNGRPAISSNSPPSGAFGMNEASSQTFQIWACDPEGNNLVYTWTWDGEAVGANSNSYTCTMDWGESGLHTLRCTVADEFWTNAVFVQWDVAIMDIPMQITTTNMPDGTEMASYSAQLEATNGPGPFSWSAWSGTPLPPGLSCSSSGLVSGAPTTAGTSVVTFLVWDDYGSATKDLTIVISPNPNTRPVLVSKAPNTNNVSILETSNQTFRVLGYDPEGLDLSYAWKWDGVTVGSNNNAYAHTAIWGSAGWHTLRCYLSDGLWTNAIFAEWSVFVEQVPRIITTDTLPAGMEMVAYSAWLSATNGAEPFSWSVWSGAPFPPGLFCSTEGHVSGYPTQAGTYGVNFVVRDRVGVQTSKTLIINIASNANTRPIIFGRAPDTNTVIMNEATNKLFRVYAYDPEGVDPLAYAWTWDGGAVGSNSSIYTHTTEWGDAGWHMLRGYASDDLWTNVVYAQWAVLVNDDNDGDGMSNGQEMDLGRNPNDPNDGGGPSSLSGTVRGEGVGLAGAYLELRGLGGRTYYQVRTDNEGAYTIDHMLPGHYFLKAGAEDFADEWYNNATHRTNALSYAIAAGMVIGGFDFDLESGQNPALVEVTSDPSGAAIYLDYQAMPNVTPAVLSVGEAVTHAIRIGRGIASHVITLKKVGRPRPVSRPVAAREAETIGMHFDMTSSATGSISISTTPEGASAYVDYADVADGTTPVVVGNLAPGSHVILLKSTGHLQPRPIVAQVQEGLTDEVAIPLASDTASERIIADVRSVPTGARIYVDYLPSTNLTDVVVDWMDPASHTGSGWHSATHTIMLRKTGLLPPAPRYVPDITNEAQSMAGQLIVDYVAAMDANADGLPDQWQDAYRLLEEAPGESGPNDDPDHDGIPNKDEMNARTNPLDASSRFEFDEVGLSAPGDGQTATFLFNTVPGGLYILQSSGDVPSGWTNLSGVILAADHQTSYTAAVPADNLHHFYRVVVLVP